MSNPSREGNKDQNETKEQQLDSLLTPKAYILSLSPPRAPPIGTWHRSILLGGTQHRRRRGHQQHHRERKTHPPLYLPKKTGEHDHKANYLSTNKGDKLKNSSIEQPEQAHSYYSHRWLSERLSQQLLQPAHYDEPRRPRHPHLAVGPELGHGFSRFLGVLLPVAWQNSCRDSGSFRWLADTAVTLSIPAMAVSMPQAASAFIRLTRQVQNVRYGAHPRHVLDLFLPEPGKRTMDWSTGRSRLIFFIHGGAWGSGSTWMYRLVAESFLPLGWAVAIVGYRTYPDGTATDQVNDCEQAAVCLSKRYPHLCRHVTVMGHSSGAHVGLLMMANRAIQQVGHPSPPTMTVESIVGLSGPYDISHHFDYEAARGVEELSPMKAACGLTRDGFRINSPALRLLDSLAHLEQNNGHIQPGRFIPRVALLHGMEDDTVPFTSTAEAARILRSCGVHRCDEIYLSNTGHQDVVMQVMLGGKARDAVLSWITHPEHQDRVTLLAKSKL